MAQEATTTKTKTMSSSGSYSSLLPPIVLGNRCLVMDWESEFVWECPKCPGSRRIPYSQLEGHRNWHERINLLIGLKRGIQPEQELIMPSFGPSTLGFLVDVNYAPSKGEHKKETPVQILAKKTPFATLKYVEGPKYTFGNKFVGRGSQGEFVFLSMGDEERWGPWAKSQKDEDKPKDENYFTLECKATDIWVTSFGDAADGMGPSPAIFINGLQIQPSTPTKVDFGDVLTVCIVGAGVEERRFRDFVFKEGPTIQKVPCRPRPDAVVNPPGVLQNPLVVQNVLGFLPTPNLQNLRVLSHLWNTEALKVLRSRVWVTVLDVDTWDGVSGRGGGAHGLDFASSELNCLHFPHWIISLPSSSCKDRKPGTPDEAEGAAIYGDKMVDDLMCLLHDTHGVQSLVLSGHPRYNESEAKALVNVLLSNLGLSLTTLVLELSPPYDIPLNVEGGFPSLRYLSLGTNMSNPILLSLFLRELLPKAETIQTLTLRSLLFTQATIQQIGKLQGEEGIPKFGNLRSITILYSDVNDAQTLSLLRRNSLNELHLGGLGEDGSGRIHLQMGLEQHAESLQELTLHFNPMHDDTSFRIDFPQSMPNLKTLCILLKSERASGDIARSVRCSFGQNVDATFVDYRAAFPSLKTLRVWPTNIVPFEGVDTVRTVNGARWNEFTPIQMAFLAPGMDEEGIPIPMPSLQIVDTPFLIQERYHPGLDHLETTFPNANFPPELASAREQQVWVPPAARDDDEGGRVGVLVAGRRPRRGRR